MNLICREVRRRITAQEVRIGFGTAFQTRNSRLVRRTRKLRFEQRNRFLPGGIHPGAHHFFRFHAYGFPAGFGDRRDGRHLLHENGHERILAGREVDKTVHLSDGGLKDETRRNDLLCLERACSGDCLLHASIHLSQSGNIILRVPLVRQRVPDRERFDHVVVDAIHLLKRKRKIQVGLFVDNNLELPLQ